MDLTDIKQLMREFSDSNIGKLSLEWDALKITLEKQTSSAQTAAPRNVTVTAAPTVEVSVGDGASDKQKDDEVAVISPVVGIYYATPSPDAPPFVTVGQTVKKGQTLCIVEAMKMMNEIPAPVSGRISRILAKPEAAVEFNQPLMFVQQD